MKNQFIVANDGTPIEIIFSETYPEWLNQQSTYIQNWLASNDFKGEGYQIIPNASGSIESIIYCIDNDYDFFIAGDLPTSLPQGTYILSKLPTALTPSETEKFTLNFAISWGLASYTYERYKNDPKVLPILALSTQGQIDLANKTISSIYLVRDMINCPAGDLMPQDISQIVDELAAKYSGISVKHIIGDELLKQNFPTIHAVGRASVHEPRLIDFTWGDSSHPKVTLVGKGVCFDSGGLDLKPASAMRNMAELPFRSLKFDILT